MRWGISTLLIDDLDIVSNLHLLRDFMPLVLQFLSLLLHLYFLLVLHLL